MSNIFLATLGQRPEAITMALELLEERFAFEKVAILHTEPRVSGIAEAYDALQDNFAGDKRFVCHELTQSNGGPLLDITNQAEAWGYYQSVVTVLRDYKLARFTLHLLVAGGRKAMAIYVTLAASLIFGGRDKVWTVLSPPELVQREQVFHIPAGMRDRVRVVELPVLPARLAPGGISSPLFDDLREVVEKRQNLRVDFLSRLTPEEQRLAETFTQHPYASNEELAAILNKAESTVENQFSSIYNRMVGFLDFGETVTRKRPVLRGILLGRLE